MNRTALVLHEACSLHDTGWQHPEHQGRLPAIVRALYADTPDLQDVTLQREGVPIAESDLLRVHSEEHVALLKAVHQRAQESNCIVALDNETMMSPASWEALLAAAGCVITACDAVLNGDARNGFALARPPGHHATADTAMGFCLANNVAMRDHLASIGVGFDQVKYAPLGSQSAVVAAMQAGVVAAALQVAPDSSATNRISAAPPSGLGPDIDVTVARAPSRSSPAAATSWHIGPSSWRTSARSRRRSPR